MRFLFKIGEFSKLTNISVKMLRYYDEINLLQPDKIDEKNKYRYYAAKKLETASKINAFKSMGFSLSAIRTLLATPDDMEAVRVHLKLREIAVKEEQEKLEQQLLRIKQFKELRDNMGEVKYIPTIKTIPNRLVVSLRKVVASYSEEGLLWQELYEYIKHNNITPLYDGYTMAIYHDKEYQETAVDIEVQVTVPNKGVSSDTVKFLTIEEYQVVAVTFVGSYNQMPEVTKAIASYFEKNKLDFSGKMLNIFHVSKAQAKREEEYVTEACYAIECE